MRGVNLIPAARRRATNRRARVRVWSAATGGYVALAIAAVIGFRVISGDGGATLAAQAQQAGAELAACKTSIAAARTELKTLLVQSDTNDVIHGRPDWSILLNMIAGATGDDIVLRVCHISPAGQAHAEATDRFHIAIGGLARSQTAVNAFVLRLERTGVLEKVKLVQSRREPFLEADAIGFDTECWIAAGPSPPTPTPAPATASASGSGTAVASGAEVTP